MVGEVAKRIKGRAVARYGELLREIEPKPGARTELMGTAAPKLMTRKQAAADAGFAMDARSANDDCVTILTYPL